MSDTPCDEYNPIEKCRCGWYLQEHHEFYANGDYPDTELIPQLQRKINDLAALLDSASLGLEIWRTEAERVSTLIVEAYNKLEGV